MKHIFRFILVLIAFSYFTLRESASPNAYVFNTLVVIAAGVTSYLLYRRDLRKKEEKMARKQNRH